MFDNIAALIVDPVDLRHQLGLVEAHLFATRDPAVIAAIDGSPDLDSAIKRLRELGMSDMQADMVIDLPLRARHEGERTALFAEAERLRRLLSAMDTQTRMSGSR